MKRKSVISSTGWAKPLENGFVPPLDGSDGDVGVRVPEFYMCVKDIGTKYQLWISDFNIDGTFTRVHPFIISHTKTMTRIREDGKEEVIRNGKAYYADSRDKTLFYSIHRLNHFPINFKITKYDWRIYAKNRKEKVKPQT